ncbi:hypothetical protein Hanom_Chr14g01247521 [Helianthus anomalus]
MFNPCKRIENSIMKPQISKLTPEVLSSVFQAASKILSKHFQRDGFLRLWPAPSSLGPLNTIIDGTTLTGTRIILLFSNKIRGLFGQDFFNFHFYSTWNNNRTFFQQLLICNSP